MTQQEVLVAHPPHSDRRTPNHVLFVDEDGAVTGGIVLRPSIILLDHRDEPEVIIPLAKLGEFPGVSDLLASIKAILQKEPIS